MDIMTYIGKGPEAAITREELVRVTHLSDRKIRNMIEDARRSGEIIINRQDGQGYYTSDDLLDLRRQYRANHSRAMSILVQQKHLRRKIKELEDKRDAKTPDA